MSTADRSFEKPTTAAETRKLLEQNISSLATVKKAFADMATVAARVTKGFDAAPARLALVVDNAASSTAALAA